MQLGFSPKVVWPNVGVFVVGLTILTVGLVQHEESIELVGLAVLGSVGVHLPLGWFARPGDVAPPEVGVGSDMRMSVQARQAIDHPSRRKP